MSQIEIRTASAEIVLPLRRDILRPGRDLDAARFAEDNSPQTLHIAAFEGERVVGVATLYPQQAPGAVQVLGSQNPWQLRGMAVDSATQKSGVGALILRAALLQVLERGGDAVWCNARAYATGFYERQGFQIYGDEFEIAGVGPHFVMARPTQIPTSGDSGAPG